MTRWWIVLLLAGAALAGCIEGDGSGLGDGTERVGGADGIANASSHWIPPEADEDGLPPHYEIPDDPSDLVEVARPGIPGGQGVWLWNDRAYVSTGSQGLIIYDIADPTNPMQIGNITGVGARDVDILNYGDRTVAVIASGGSYHFFDVTEPGTLTDEDALASFPGSGHNIAVHRPGHVVYNSRSLGTPPGGAEIIDASDPDDIKLHKAWEFGGGVAENGKPIANTGCHDVVVYPDQNRAYCPAVTQTLVWDVTDPLNPVVLDTIENPLISIHHSAHTILDHSVLVIGDEAGGAILYACYGHQSTPVADASTPTGAIWFYDLTTPTPTLMSWLSMPPVENPPSTCTAHFGEAVGDEDSGHFSYGWYTAGTILVDATDPMTPRLDAQILTGGSTWDARHYRGYVFAGEGSQGLGVYEIQ